MRGVPDVSGDADPETGYDVRIDGTDTVIGGTSAVAPLWSGLLARVNQLAGKSVGYLQPVLYQNPQALRDITQGNNGDFYASTGWDAARASAVRTGRPWRICLQPPPVGRLPADRSTTWRERARPGCMTGAQPSID